MRAVLRDEHAAFLRQAVDAEAGEEQVQQARMVRCPWRCPCTASSCSAAPACRRRAASAASSARASGAAGPRGRCSSPGRRASADSVPNTSPFSDGDAELASAPGSRAWRRPACRPCRRCRGGRRRWSGCRRGRRSSCGRCRRSARRLPRGCMQISAPRCAQRFSQACSAPGVARDDHRHVADEGGDEALRLGQLGLEAEVAPRLAAPDLRLLLAVESSVLVDPVGNARRAFDRPGPHEHR